MPRPPRSRSPWLHALGLALLAAALVELVPRPARPTTAPTPDREIAPPRPAPAPLASTGGAGATPPSPVPRLPAAGAGPSEREACLLRRTPDGRIVLLSVQRLRGDFGPPRGPLAWRPGLWCVRILDAAGRPLAQQTMRPLDETCVVLDPHAPSPSGEPAPARLTPEEMIAQIRLPVLPGASAIRIHRIDTDSPLPLDAALPGPALAAFPLPR